MTQFEFMALCGKYLIDADIALENENIVKALRTKNSKEVENILLTEF
jgi:hypothetical protein